MATTFPDGAEDLRQGDLVVGLTLPALKLPLSFIAAGGTGQPGDQIVLGSGARPLHYLIVSQCCDLEKRPNVALAPIRSTGRLNGDQLIAFHTAEPDEANDTGYVYNSFRLDPVEPDVATLTGGRLSVAAFQEIATFQGKTDSIRSLVRARMTPEGRRLLRIKLSPFWGRPEDEDEKHLAAVGLPAGLR